MTEANIAVLIDYENVGLDSIQELLDQLSDMGRVIIKRAYADWSVQRGRRDQLLELGIEAIHHFRSTKSGKNSSDICLAIDAVDLLHGAPVDTFVIVSSDSDFVPLVSKLRGAGKSVIGSGRRDVTSPTLVKSCDRYFYLDDFHLNDAKPPPEKKDGPREKSHERASLIVRAVEASMDDQGQVLGSKLAQTMLRIDPSFSFKGMGHRTFAAFLQSRNEVRVERPKEASDLIVQLNHSRDQSTADGDAEAPLRPNWDHDIDSAWEGRQRRRISGQATASDAAKVLGAPKLRSSRFPTLDKLLAASDYLRTRWRREGNSIIKK